MDIPTLQVLVTADLARAPRVAAVAGLPELIATEAVDHAIHDSWNLEDLGVGAPIPAAMSGAVSSAADSWTITTAHGLARLFAAVGWRESLFGRALAKDGSGDGGHGWGPWQADIRSHGQLVAAIRACVVGSPEWWQVCAHGCMPIFVTALQEYPSSLEAGVARYNASKERVDAGLARGNPSELTTGGDYGRAVLATASAWWV